MNVRDDLVGKLQHDEDDVLELSVEQRVLVRAHPFGHSFEEIEQDRDVVRAEVPERVEVLADDTEVETVRIGVDDPAELARPDQLSEDPHRLAVDERVPDHERQ